MPRGSSGFTVIGIATRPARRALRADDGTKEAHVIEGVSQVIVDVEDQDRALKFWTAAMQFELARDAAYGKEGRWIEVRTGNKATSWCSGSGAGIVRRRPKSCPRRTRR
ncbi:MAG TPA: hypothetical protein VFL41_04870 [Gaiellaceae bacterium]|nr:hypothetical protein [Gaiellaceae bacterium]